MPTVCLPTRPNCVQFVGLCLVAPCLYITKIFFYPDSYHICVTNTSSLQDKNLFLNFFITVLFPYSPRAQCSIITILSFIISFCCTFSNFDELSYKNEIWLHHFLLSCFKKKLWGRQNGSVAFPAKSDDLISAPRTHIIDG